MLNVETIQYLVNYFKSTITLIGKTDYAVDNYRKNTYELVKIRQLGYYEVKLVEKLLGMENTDNLKWDITFKKIRNFEEALNYLLPYGFDCLSALNKLKDLKNNNIVDNSVFSILQIIYLQDGFIKLDKKPLVTIREKKKAEEELKKEELRKKLKLDESRNYVKTTYDSCRSRGTYGGGVRC